RRRHTRCYRDWSSDVCSSDLTPVGIVPDPAELDLTGLEISPDQLRQALVVNRDEWTTEMASSAEFFDRIRPSVPEQLRELHRSRSEERRVGKECRVWCGLYSG